MARTGTNLIRYQLPYPRTPYSGRKFREIGFGDETRMSALAIKILR
jgi:hypothetical protein